MTPQYEKLHIITAFTCLNRAKAEEYGCLGILGKHNFYGALRLHLETNYDVLVYFLYQFIALVHLKSVTSALAPSLSCPRTSSQDVRGSRES